MATHQHLPTWFSGRWSVADFRDSLIRTLNADQHCKSLSLYFYAVTQSGWDQVREPILHWNENVPERNASLIVGTDHGITDPSALQQISDEGVDVRLMRKYNGVYHPKLVWLQGESKNIVWVGSNNLTRDGLLNNVEFALLVKGVRVPSELDRWAKSVRSGSEELTPTLLESYKRQRRKFEKGRSPTFTWGKKVGPEEKPTAIPKAGDLVVEVMPRETGEDGRQLQLPTRATSDFFGVKGVGSSKSIQFGANQSSVVRTHTMTVFKNNTVRIVVSDLEYRDRPCVLVFRKLSEERFQYEIVSKSIFPSRYKRLLKLCKEQTRSGSRRWGIA